MSRYSEKDAAARVYLGPSFYGIIQKGTVMTGGIPPKMQTLLEKHPFLNGLLVPLEELAGKRNEIHKTGTEMNMLYEEARQIKEGKHV